MANTIGQSAYNIYTGISDFSYWCITYLMENDEVIWKLLKYNDPDAWREADLTKEEKASLIFNGFGSEADYKVFMDVGQPDAWVHEATLVRISPYNIIPANRTIGTLAMMFEVYAHYKLNHLSNYRTRVDWIAERLLAVFNGSLVGGIGRLHFDRLGTYESKMMTIGQIPFKGKWIIMGAKVA